MSDIDGRIQRQGYGHRRLVQDALGYAALELRVIPLHGKTPFLERWPERATNDPAQIVRWFETWHDKNLGIVTGDGLFAVDVDPRNGGEGSFRKLFSGRKLPTTATALTGSGGNHYLFRVDPALSIGNATNLLPGIDIKGAGGQIAVEPSVHPRTGKEYVWLRTPQQGIADAPTWLLDRVVKPRRQPSLGPGQPLPVELTRTGDAGRLLDDAICRFPVTGRGQRNGVMVRVTASLLGRGYDADQTQAVVTGWWQHFYDRGTISTSPSEAPREVGACIRAILGSTKFSRAVGVNHREAVEKIELNSMQRALLEGFITPTGIAYPTPHSNRVTTGEALCGTENERLFVEALVVYFTYKTVLLAESPPKATNDQLRWPIWDRHGKTWANQTFDREFVKYVSRPTKPATRYELAVQTLKGRQTIPSEYELTGLLQLLPPEALESILKRPTRQH